MALDDALKLFSVKLVCSESIGCVSEVDAMLSQTRHVVDFSEQS